MRTLAGDPVIVLTALPDYDKQMPECIFIPIIHDLLCCDFKMQVQIAFVLCVGARNLSEPDPCRSFQALAA